MSSYDYLLYDNRTLGSGSYDWGVKVASGDLALDRTCRSRFVEYCEHSFNTRVGLLRDFDAALGGLSLSKDRYLVCISLETADRSGRASCAFVGIPCSDRTELATLLAQGDPIAMARSVYQSETPPSALELKGSSSPKAIQASERAPTGLQQFGGSSPDQASALLRRAITARAELPDILGVAVWSTEFAESLKRYDVAFCQRLPSHLVTTAAVRPELEKAPVPASRSGGMQWVAGAAVVSIVALIVVILFALLEPKTPQAPQRRTGPQQSAPAAAAAPDPTRSGEPTTPPDTRRTNDPQSFLAGFKGILDRMDGLSEDRLLQTVEHDTLRTVSVLASHQPRRDALLTLLESDLPTFKEQVDAQNLPYFYQRSRVEALSPAERTTEIAKRILDLRPPTDACAQLRAAFEFLLSQPESVAREWCEVVDALAAEIDGARSLSVAENHKTN